jgi:hypothetical protein
MKIRVIRRWALAAGVVVALTLTVTAQMQPTAPRGAGDGDGPHERLVIRGVTGACIEIEMILEVED